MWSDYTGEQPIKTTENRSDDALAPEYLDVFVSSVRDSDPFAFSIQILDEKSAPSVHVLRSMPDGCRRRVSGEANE